MTGQRVSQPGSNRAIRAAFVIGVALSGFFDGILLHQILQWHHLLSLVPGQTFRDLRVQIYADGLFHVVVYAVALLGLYLLWRARDQFDRPGAGMQIAGGALLGFGAWNIVDVGFLHWILGIHRVRVNVPNPMAYDLAWFVVLGLAVGLAGLWLIRRSRGVSLGNSGGAAAGSLVVALVAALQIANIPVAGSNTLVVFRPDVQVASEIDAIRAANARIVMIEPEGGFAVVRMAEDSSRLPFYRAGALLVTRSPALAGCFAFTDRT